MQEIQKQRTKAISSIGKTIFQIMDVEKPGGSI